jgi:hypothetical protein
MKTEIGDLLKNRLTGKFYKVKKINIEKVMLEAEDIPNKVWYGDKECIGLLYEEAENQDRKN